MRRDRINCLTLFVAPWYTPYQVRRSPTTGESREFGCSRFFCFLARLHLYGPEPDKQTQLALAWIEAAKRLGLDVGKKAHEECDDCALPTLTQQEVKHV